MQTETPAILTGGTEVAPQSEEKNVPFNEDNGEDGE